MDGASGPPPPPPPGPGCSVTNSFVTLGQVLTSLSSSCSFINWDNGFLAHVALARIEIIKSNVKFLLVNSQKQTRGPWTRAAQSQHALWL